MGLAGVSLSQAYEALDGGVGGAIERMPKRSSGGNVGEQEVKRYWATGRVG